MKREKATEITQRLWQPEPRGMWGDAPGTSLAYSLAVLAALASAAGCSRRDEPMGPAQQAGKAIDDAGARVADKVHEQVDKADRAAKAMRERADEARDKIKDATADASRKLDQATEQVGKKVEQAGEKIQQAAH